jgi:RimJ/RimL family protein N-acetyltransferase
MPAAFTIETERLTLRPIATCDEELYCRLYSDAETMRFIGPPLTRERALRSFHKLIEQCARENASAMVMTAVEKATGQAVGICSLQNIDVGRRRADGGVMLLPEGRAHGYSVEGYVGFVEQIFARLPIDEVWLETASDHAVVARAVASAGFVRRRDAEQDSGRQGHCLWSAHRESWAPKVHKYPSRA